MLDQLLIQTNNFDIFMEQDLEIGWKKFSFFSHESSTTSKRVYQLRRVELQHSYDIDTTDLTEDEQRRIIEYYEEMVLKYV